ncbi:unnamed protein product [Closterium sp. Naga37s-1]|nr:unnamed protein product [Closterium sp. Naga37s-1]
MPHRITVPSTALHYEVLWGAEGIGAHVRDAAAYVCWAIAHSFSPPVPSLLPPCNGFALPSLPLRGVTARWAAVTARWAAAAAFQEVVGCFGCISDAQALSTPTTRGTPHASTRGAGQGGDAVESGAKKEEQWAPAGGIAIVNAADVTSLSSTRTPFTQVPTTAAPFSLRSRNHSHPPLPHLHLHMHMHHCHTCLRNRHLPLVTSLLLPLLLVAVPCRSFCVCAPTGCPLLSLQAIAALLQAEFFS